MAVHGSKRGPLLRISSDEYLPGLTRSGWRQTIDMCVDDIHAIVRQHACLGDYLVQHGFDTPVLDGQTDKVVSCIYCNELRLPAWPHGAGLQVELRRNAVMPDFILPLAGTR